MTSPGCDVAQRGATGDPLGELLVVEVVEQVDRAQVGQR